MSLKRIWGDGVKFMKKSRLDRALRDGAIRGIAGMGGYTGRGAYEAGTETNNLMIDGNRTSMVFGGDGDETQSLIITHREYVGDIYGAASAAFTNSTYSLNPGMLFNFPWLAQFALNFEEYEFQQLVYDFKSTVDASASSNSAGNTGTIIMATQYNPNALPYTDKESMMQAHGAVSGRLTNNIVHGVECDGDKNAGSAQKYTRAGNVNQDLKNYDLGTFNLAQVNIPSAFYSQQVGELWVTYSVKFDKPRLYASNAGIGLSYKFFGNYTSAATSTSNLFTPNSIAPCVSSQNSLNMVVGQGATSSTATTLTNQWIRFTFPDTVNGVFEIRIWLEGTGFTTSQSTPPWTVGNVVPYTNMFCVTVPGTPGTTPGYWYSFCNSNNVVYHHASRWRVNAATSNQDNQVNIELLTASTGVSGCYIEVTEISPYDATSNTTNYPVFNNITSGLQTSLILN